MSSLAVFAQPVKLYMVALHSERCIHAQPGEQVFDATPFEVGDQPALRAYQMMMMGLIETAHHIAVPPANFCFGVHALQYAQTNQQVERAEHCGPANVRVASRHAGNKLARRERPVMLAYALEYGLPGAR
jgi:hypothetical protein